MKNLILFVALLFTTLGFSQDKEKEKIHPDKIQFAGVYKNSISLNGGGTSGTGGISWEHLLSKHLVFDFGLGYIGGGAGFKFLPYAVQRGTSRFHVNLCYSVTILPEISHFQQFYVGVGTTWFMTRKFNFSLDIGPAYYYHFLSSPKFFPDRWIPMGNLKIGYRFSLVAMKRRIELINNDDTP